MRVILTHEQADFDALAALLGAWLLNDSDFAAMPRRCNRNVRSFLTLYGADLPFIDPRDLPAEPIESILVVDSQNPITLKGSSPETRIRVIDHHPARPDLPPDWQVQIEPLGASTTIFAEILQENGGTLTAVQATLMLLGIYEDTGSLTYSATTPRDIRAAAFLLEQGANLAILTRYLNPPLTPDQRKVYERLLASAETVQIHSQKVVIACAPAEDMREEVSSIAHKLRDLLEPDGLFLFVTTGEGIRLVARSTTSRINVNDITAAFGGGGHERAAAALIRVEDTGSEDKAALLAECYVKLKSLLPKMVKPSITVGQIMSPGPRLLAPETSAQEAALLMQRYGYEGYPVVRGGKVVGLLTRRAVDRAVAHKLNLTALSLMDAGEVTVRPGDSIEQLQHVMTRTGWGQVPVVSPETGEVIGIVTRTDLLKTLAAPAQVETRRNLAVKLEQALPPARLALLRLVAQEARDLHQAVYIVGGFVRDLLLDRPSQDLDIVVEGDAIQLANRLKGRFGGQVIAHSRFGTAKWAIQAIREEVARELSQGNGFHAADLPATLDLVTARREFYEHPTALPTVERGSIKLDLHRRDFTINTLALRLDGRHYGELYDYWGGVSDLERGLIRVLHSLSFIEDPTRLLRAVRFEQRFGFQIEERTLQLVSEARSMLKQLSGDRIRHELDLILMERDPDRTLMRLNELGILPAIHPDLPAHIDEQMLAEPDPAWNIEPRAGSLPAARLIAYLVWLSPLDATQLDSVAERLRFSGAVREILHGSLALRTRLAELAGAAPSRAVQLLEPFPGIVLYAAYQLCGDPQIREALLNYVTRWQFIRPGANGETLARMGIPPGPLYRLILTELRSAWLDGQLTHIEEEPAFIRNLMERE